MESLKYTYAVDDLTTGASLGNLRAFARLDETTNLHGLWSAADNRYYLGQWNVDVFVNGHLLIPVETSFEPEAQTTLLIHPEGEAERKFFLPLILEPSAEDDEKLRAAIYLIRLCNTGSRACEFRLRHELTLPAVISEKFTKNPFPEETRGRYTCVQKANCIEISCAEQPHEGRVFGSSVLPLSVHCDERKLNVEYYVPLQPGEVMELPFVFAFSPDGVAIAKRSQQQCTQASSVLTRTRAEYAALLSRSYVFTPNVTINRSLQWAKVNTARVQHRYRIGLAFTNDPPQDIVVVRDVAWYVLGADYLTPSFTREILDTVNRYAVHPDGKLTEYIHANELPPALHDYHLNINDDTPLYIYALYHHAMTCGSADFLRSVYPIMRRAGKYILSQMHNGLVRCTAEGTGVWGICGWRNIIQNYTLNGAVTEINAECSYALQLLSRAAAILNLNEDATRFARAAQDLRENINKELISEKTGFYILNEDTHGVRHYDLTGDLIFPVLFDVAEPALRSRILDMLLGEKFWTPYGTRTVSPDEPSYDPDYGYQLMGGAWPNLTAWVAYCVRENLPEKLIEGMLNCYRLSEVEKPKNFGNVVPGQFPERLHGETFVSRGMAMSPWMPPTYLWLGIEGLLGVGASHEGLEVNPCIPSSWKWIAVKDLLYRGERVSAFFYDGVLYATQPIRSRYPVRVGSAVSCTTSNDHLFACGIECKGTLLLFIAADAEVQGFVTAETSQGSAIREVFFKAGEAEFLEIPVASLRIAGASSKAASQE